MTFDALPRRPGPAGAVRQSYGPRAPPHERRWVDAKMTHNVATADGGTANGGRERKSEGSRTRLTKHLSVAVWCDVTLPGINESSQNTPCKHAVRSFTVKTKVGW